MKKYIYLITEKLKELYEQYHRYCWYNKEKGINIDVIIGENSINYYLRDNEGVTIDEFMLTFKEKEKVSYDYLSIKVFTGIFENITIYNNGNIYYNEFYRPNTRVIVNDENIIEMINNMRSTTEKNTINNSHPMIKKLYKKIPLHIHNKAIISMMGERIRLNKKLMGEIE